MTIRIRMDRSIEKSTAHASAAASQRTQMAAPGEAQKNWRGELGAIGFLSLGFSKMPSFARAIRDQSGPERGLGIENKLNTTIARTQLKSLCKYLFRVLIGYSRPCSV